MPSAIATTTSRWTAGAEPNAVTIRHRSWAAVPNESARKNTHPRHTT